MSKLELENLKKNYLYNSSKSVKGLCFPKNEDAIIIVLDAFVKSIPFERPDGFCIFNKTLYLFEHFSIDSSCTVKGSSYMKLKHDLDLQDLRDGQRGCKEIVVQESFQYYIDNFRRIVREHYKNIGVYRENVIKETNGLIFDSIKMVFVGENPLPLGVRIIEDNGVIELIPLFYRNFLYDLLKYKNIDYFLFFSHGLNSNFVTGIDMKYIDDNYKIALKLNKKTYIDSDYLEILNKN